MSKLAGNTHIEHLLLVLGSALDHNKPWFPSLVSHFISIQVYLTYFKLYNSDTVLDLRQSPTPNKTEKIETSLALNSTTISIKYTETNTRLRGPPDSPRHMYKPANINI